VLASFNFFDELQVFNRFFLRINSSEADKPFGSTIMDDGVVKQSIAWRNCEASARRSCNSRSVQILTPSCFNLCEFLISIEFESNSGLKGTESYAFSSSSLQSIEIRRRLEILCSKNLSYRLVGKYMRQPPALGSGARLSGYHISTIWTLRKGK
jgi:hypothetical protein